ERAAAAAGVGGGDEGAVDDAPEVGLEKPMVVLIGDRGAAAAEGDAGVADPGIEDTEVGAGGIGGALEVGAAADIGDDVDRLSAGGVEFLFDGSKGFFVAGDEDEASALFGGGASGGESDAAGRTGDDEDLFAKRFQAHGK